MDEEFIINRAKKRKKMGAQRKQTPKVSKPIPGRKEEIRRHNMLIKAKNNMEDLPKGLRIDTTTGEGANITKFSKGGSCRGAGAAVKGTKFEGVF